MVTGGFSVKEIRNGKPWPLAKYNPKPAFTPEELRGAFTATELRKEGFSFAQLKDAYSGYALLNAGFTREQISSAGVPLREEPGPFDDRGLPDEWDELD